ncbi:MAG: tRNA dihydrouridine synthase DusB [Nanoarchaeota archaeon]
MFLKLKGKTILAPMAEVTDYPFRALCARYGAAMTYTEQLSAVAINHDSPKTLRLARTSPQEGPVGIQLFGRDAQQLLAAARRFEKEFDVVDINCGCPSKKIVSQGYGSALLKEKEFLHDMLRTLVDGLSVPVTVKMRSGFKQNEAVEIVKVLEKAGVSAVTIHARTQEQGYRGKADWDIIRDVKNAVSIPVIGNGDVDTPQKAKEMLDYTGCDYIMVGRAAMKNPWIFTQINHYLKTGEILAQTSAQKLALIQEYVSLAEDVSLSRLKLVVGHFTKEVPGGKRLREIATRAKSRASLLAAVHEFHPG